MASRAEKDRQKQIQDKCQALLTQMLRDEDNKYCVDCDAKGPRWASWNLGIFLCIRCAGIHRNLGVHISKVKSVNLDTWTPEQVVSLQQMGNSRARAVYEANLPDNFRRPQTDSSLEAFVRAKYEQKKYIAREWVPPSIPKVNWDKELDEEAERQRRRKKEAKQQQNRKSNTSLAEVPVPQLLPKPKSSTSPKPGRTVADPNRKSATQDLLGLDTPVNSTAGSSSAGTSSNGEDIFTNFLSAPPATGTTSVSTSDTVTESESNKSQGRTAEEESFFNQPAPSSQEKRQLTKDSILALYSTGPAPTPAVPASVFGMPGGVYTQQAPAFQQVPSTMNFGLPGTSALPNGMMQTQTLPATIMQNGTFNTGGAIAPQQPTIASNPFFNMGTTIAAPAQNFQAMSQEHASSTGQDLMLDFGTAVSSVNQLPQQMNRLNLGGPVMSAQPQPILGVAPPSVAMGMQVPAMGIPSGLTGSSATLGMSAFPQQPGQGQTLATNLWQ
ncbi:hypothetical protein R5R35_001866 [Gryllus longicercus]|uniref:Arf-GAP domain-containing protein n=1 Tax=Gryllus longicercus TaxID=2509291 RepID=A0AAN9Z2A6_9ORTH